MFESLLNPMLLLKGRVNIEDGSSGVGGGTPAPEVDPPEESLFIEDEATSDDDQSEEDDDLPEDDVTDDDDDSDLPDDDTQEEDTPNEFDDKKVKFDEKQTAKINEIVKTRITKAVEKSEQKFMDMIQDAAGTELNLENGGEMIEAVKLWGFMKLNPTLSNQVQQVIDTFMSTNQNIVQPQYKQEASKEQELELKEAIVDLKAEDKQFAKNAKQVLEWAEENGYDIKNKKTLDLVFKAWKNEAGKVDLASQQLQAQRKAQKKANTKKSAVLENSKTGKGKGAHAVDYTKMSDKDVLASLGVSLYTED